MTEQQKDSGYSWTDQYKRSWDIIKEDGSGSLSLSAAQLLPADLQEMLLTRLKWIQRSLNCQRGILRHVMICVDMSAAMGSKDFRPSYLELTCALLKQFVVEFFDQNPISLLGLLITKDGIAQRVSDLSGNPQQHKQAIESLRDSAMLKGEPSLMNCLELARICLSHAPSKGIREVILISASLTSRDPGNITETIEKLRKDQIICNIIGLCAEIHICKKISQETGGVYRVALDEDHYKSLLMDRIVPPPLQDEKIASQLYMGFPTQVMDTSLCACHSSLTKNGYKCPRCGSKQCHLPTDCSICGLKLISAPHLARNYHHLFPVFPFVEVQIPSYSSESISCYACTESLDFTSISVSEQKEFERKELKSSQKLVTAYQCRNCTRNFCLACDVFIHESLHCCPGCG